MYIGISAYTADKHEAHIYAFLVLNYLPFAEILVPIEQLFMGSKDKPLLNPVLPNYLLRKRGISGLLK